jgi:hypothetical protein
VDVGEPNADDPEGGAGYLTRSVSKMLASKQSSSIWQRVFAEMLDAGETWTDKIEQHLLDKIKVNDMSIVIPYDKDTHQSEFQDVANNIGISLELLFSVGHLIVNSQVNYHYIETGKSLNVVAASAPAAQLLMSDQKEFSSEAVNYLG